MAQFEVLLASDFTARTDRPLDRAIQLAGEQQGSLVIAHVLEKSTEGDQADVLNRLRTELPDAARHAELVVRQGSAPRLLAALAEERRSDLIITGVARYNSVGDYFLGTAVDHIVRNAAKPVLIVKRRITGPYRSLLVAADLSDCSRAALLTAASLFPEATITLVHVFHVPYEGWIKSDDSRACVRTQAQGELDAFTAGIDPAVRERTRACILEGEIGTAIAQELSRTNADLLVLGTHGRSGFGHATIGSHAEALLSAVNVDVLMVRECK